MRRLLGKTGFDRVRGMIDSRPEREGGREEKQAKSLRVVEEEELGISSSEAREIKRVKLEDGQGEKKWFIGKEYAGEDQVKEQVKKYQFLQARGYPVPEEAFVWPENEKVILVEDLSKGGEKEVYSSNNWPEGIKAQLKNKEEIGNQLREVVRKAKEDGVMITMDSYFLVVDKGSHEGGVVIGDWGAAGISEEEKRERGYEGEEAVAEAAEALYQVVNKRFAKNKDGRVVLGGGYLWKK